MNNTKNKKHLSLLANIINANATIEEIQIPEIITAINALEISREHKYVEILIPLVKFQRTVYWYFDKDGHKDFVGWKEIGVPIRLAAVKALGNFGDTRALPVLCTAQQDRGDMDKELGSPRWYIRHNADEIREEAKKAIAKIQRINFKQ